MNRRDFLIALTIPLFTPINHKEEIISQYKCLLTQEQIMFLYDQGFISQQTLLKFPYLYVDSEGGLSDNVE